ncbi:MAG: hypothetical protein Q9M91_02640 [Candidatus Dojkabacteria bacterium]|nr:hypothetical protein [Candidatus Dojkabacteria bacterium]MDQ7020722.1 hypothetical protein [Candidatus Dojkabacteria bacterium]
MITDPTHKFNEFVDKDKEEEVLYHAFARTYQEVNFMFDDPYFKELMVLVNSNSYLSKIWNEFSSGNLPKVRNIDTRRVYFKYNGIKISMEYSNEPIPNFDRFRLLEHKPTSFIIRILQKFL